MLDGDGLIGPRIDIGAFERVNDFDPNDPNPEVIQLGNITVNVEQVATGLVSPSLVVNAGDNSGRVFISDQIEFVHLVKNGAVQGTPFLDVTASITDTLNGNSEVGLSGFTFHPNFAVSGSAGYGKVYTLVDELVDAPAPVDFTHFPLAAGEESAAQSVLREYTMSNIADDVFSGTSRELLRIDQPHDAHSAGNVVFGPDRLLYISLGDGGTHDDQGPGHNPDTGNARDLSVVYGKILRIDPHGTSSVNGKNEIPGTNPFIGDANALDEILFYGFRNPFRFSFEIDASGNKTTRAVVGDTGQDDIAEVDRADIIDHAGGHFGWNIKGGTFHFDAGPPPGPGGEVRSGATANIADNDVAVSLVSKVRVRLINVNYLHLAEVEVIEQGTGTNLARAGTASQSSTYNSNTGAGKANDGDSTAGYPISINHTNLEAAAWWQVNLGGGFDVATVIVHNRPHAAGARQHSTHCKSGQSHQRRHGQ